jgi:hypothetical protein
MNKPYTGRKLDALQQNEKIVVKVTLHENGALSVEGPLHDKQFCKAMLMNAIEAVNNHGLQTVVIPGNDVDVPDLKPKLVM